MEQTVFELNYLGESSQRELCAYRNIGSVEHLKRLRRKEYRRQRRLKHLEQALKAIIGGACILLAIWVVMSWVDVIARNMYPNPVYANWNLFTLIF